MQVLWSINSIPREIAESIVDKSAGGHTISWVQAMSEVLKQRRDIQLIIVAPGGKKVKALQKKEYENVIYYILPKDYRKKDYWGKIIDDVKPDIIHIYGTEKKHNINLIRKYSNHIPILISLQGIINEYVRYYYAGLSIISILKNYTWRDIYKNNGIFSGRLAFLLQCKYERFMLKNVTYVEGRSDWDHAYSEAINPQLKYYLCPRMIRHSFFDFSWDYEDYEEFSLFVHQGNYPIKGLHFMIDALNILRNIYPNIKLYVSGDNFDSNKNKSGYIKLINKKIQKYKIHNSIVFTGYMNAHELAERLSKVSICVIPSAIENAPNALAEAMIVGTPCVASDVGGNADMLNYGECGLLYCYDEPEMLADRIKKYLNDKDLMKRKSDAARSVARKRHDPKTLENTIMNIYQDIISNFRINY